MPEIERAWGRGYTPMTTTDTRHCTHIPFEDFAKVSTANFLLFGEQPLRIELLVLVVPGRRRVPLLQLLFALCV